jgi:PAS domain S-box-containing protein
MEDSGESERTLRESEQRYRALVEMSPDGIVVHDGGILVFANPAAARLFGVQSPAAMLGRPVMDFVHPDYRHAVAARIRSLIEDRRNVPRLDEKFVTLDGRVIDVEVTAAAIVFEGRPSVQVVVRDVTETRLIQRKLARQSRQLAARNGILDAALRNVELDVLAQRILDEMLGLLGIEVGGVLLRNRDIPETLRLQGIDPDRIDLNGSWVGYEGETTLCGRSGTDESPFVLESGECPEAWAIVPLVVPASEGVDVEVVGTLFVASREPAALGPDFVEAMVALGELASLAVAHLRAYRRAEQRLSRLHALREADRISVQERDLAEMMPAFLEAVPDEFGSDALGVSLVGEDGVHLSRAWIRCPGGAVHDEPPLLLDDDFRVGILTSGQPAFLDEQALEGKVSVSACSGWGSTAPRTWAGFPIMGSSGALGILHVLSASNRELPPDGVEFFQALAGRIALGIEHSRAFDSATRRAQAIEVLLEAQVRISQSSPKESELLLVDAFANACNVSSVCYFRLDPSGTALEMSVVYGCDSSLEEVLRGMSFSLGCAEGLVGLVAASNEPIHVPERAQEPRWQFPDARLHSAYLVPISFGERLSGVAVLLGEEPRAFGSLTRALADLTAHYVGSAMEHARLVTRIIEAEGRYRSIFENAVEGIYQSEPAGTLAVANPAMAALLGYGSPDELLAEAGAFLARLHADPERAGAFLESMAEHGEVRGLEYPANRRDGTAMWLSENAQVIRDASGNIVRWEGMVSDITRRKDLESQLQHSQKMEAIGRLAGGVAHDFNNLLTAILGYSGLLLNRAELGDDVRGEIQEIWDAGRRASALTRQLLAFSRNQVLQPVVLDLGSTLEGVEQLLRRLIGEDILLETRLMPGLGRIKADPGQIEQVVINLAINSRDAMPSGGRLIIETFEVELKDGPSSSHLSLPPGRYVLMSVSDTGSGMDTATRTRIFEPFFTTKPAGQGTGLGLSVVYGIVRQSNGDIFVYSEPGVGTTFKVYLPVVADVRDEPALELERNLPWRGNGETILVVEDEASVRALVRLILEEAGYTVIEAPAGLQAIEVASSFEGRIHLLMTDIVMPGMNGPELARLLIADRPDMRVLFSSGYSDELVMKNGMLEPGTLFVQKPFEPRRLLEVIRELLDRKPD